MVPTSIPIQNLRQIGQGVRDLFLLLDMETIKQKNCL